MPKKITSKSKMTAESRAKLLSGIPYERGFHFFTSIGNFTGITATNLNDFAAQLQVVPLESIDFHFQRRDFQKWIAETVGDKELAEKISLFGAARSAQDLSKQMLRIVQQRISELSISMVANEDALVGATIPPQL